MIVIPIIFRRVIINKFIEAGAIDSDHAMNLQQLGISETRVFSRLVKDGKVISVDSLRYYLNIADIRNFNKNR